MVSTALILKEDHPRFKKMRYDLLALSRFYNNTSAAANLILVNEITPLAEIEARHPDMQSIYTPHTFKVYQPMTNIAKREKVELEQYLNKARRALKANNIIKKDELYSDADTIKLYEQFSGEPFVPFSERIEQWNNRIWR